MFLYIHNNLLTRNVLVKNKSLKYILQLNGSAKNMSMLVSVGKLLIVWWCVFGFVYSVSKHNAEYCTHQAFN